MEYLSVVSNCKFGYYIFRFNILCHVLKWNCDKLLYNYILCSYTCYYVKNGQGIFYKGDL